MHTKGFYPRGVKCECVCVFMCQKWKWWAAFYIGYVNGICYMCGSVASDSTYAVQFSPLLASNSLFMYRDRYSYYIASSASLRLYGVYDAYHATF